MAPRPGGPVTGSGTFHEGCLYKFGGVQRDDLTAAELRVLVAVAGEGSLSGAAVRLDLTQPAVSHALRSAERKIGAVLFRRGRHGARPTAAGETVVGHARRVLAMMDVMRAEAHHADGGQATGTLRVAAFRSAAFHLLPAALVRFGHRHPKVTVDVRIVADLGRGIAGEVLDGHAEIGVLGLPAQVEGLVYGELFDEPYVMAYPAGHPDPRSLPLINWHENCSADTRRWLAGQDWIPAGSMTVRDDGVVVSMVDHGLGVAIVPRLTVAGAPARVSAMDLTGDAPLRRVGYAVTREMAASTLVRDLVAALRATVPRALAAADGRRGPSGHGPRDAR